MNFSIFTDVRKVSCSPAFFMATLCQHVLGSDEDEAKRRMEAIYEVNGRKISLVLVSHVDLCGDTRRILARADVIHTISPVDNRPDF